jgi:hypothetical protein
LIVLDTDLLALYHFFLHDPRHNVVMAFMHATKGSDRSTTIYNLLELSGITSAAGKTDVGKKLIENYANARDMRILYPTLSPLSPESFWSDYTAELSDIMGRGLRYGDAKILWVAEAHEASILVTWNTRHYRGKTQIQVLTPAEYTAGQGKDET